MNKSQKTEAVTQLNQVFEENEIVVVCQYKGLTVAEITDFRSKLRAEGANFKVTKNRLARLALKGTRYEGLDSHFVGPTGIAISKDPVAAAKIAQSFSKTNEKLVIIAGALGTKMLDAASVELLSKLPSLDGLRSQLIGILQAPASKMVGVLQAPAGQIARVVGAYGAKGE